MKTERLKKKKSFEFKESKLINSDKIFIGIDPGKDGFICEMTENNINFWPVPKVGKQVDLAELSTILEQYKNTNCHCIIEDVHAIFGSAAKSTFEFGRIVGNLEALLVAFKIPYTAVTPKKWQKEMWEGIPVQKKPSTSKKTMVTNTKKMSEVAAKRLFPEIDLRKTTRAKNPDDNKIDSLLLVEYCRRNYK